MERTVLAALDLTATIERSKLGPMTVHRYSTFERYVTGYEPDGVDWCDGGAADEASQLLADFEDADWLKLCADLDHKDRLWRGCVATTLNPYLGKHAQDLIIHLLDDPDKEVSFDALRIVAFYCGVNYRKEGPFIDDSILHREFFAKIKSHGDIMSKIKKIKEGASASFSDVFTLLEYRISE